MQFFDHQNFSESRNDFAITANPGKTSALWDKHPYGKKQRFSLLQNISQNVLKIGKKIHFQS